MIKITIPHPPSTIHHPSSAIRHPPQLPLETVHSPTDKPTDNSPDYLFQLRQPVVPHSLRNPPLQYIEEDLAVDVALVPRVGLVRVIE